MNKDERPIPAADTKNSVHQLRDPALGVMFLSVKVLRHKIQRCFNHEHLWSAVSQIR
jgi:hypothetical protein